MEKPLEKHGPAFGYHLNQMSHHCQGHQFEKAQHNFVHDEVEKVDGCRVLGSVLGSDNAEKVFLERSLKKHKLLL